MSWMPPRDASSRAAPPNPKAAIMKTMMSSKDAPDVLEVCSQQLHQLDHVALVAGYYRMAKLG